MAEQLLLVLVMKNINWPSEEEMTYTFNIGNVCV